MSLTDLAAFGGPPAFPAPLRFDAPVLPAWSKVEAAFRAIFARGYFANHGPAVTAFERDLASFLGVDHAVAVTNETVALMVLARSLDRPGDIIVPAFAPPTTLQALAWAGMTTRICDVDSSTGNLSLDQAEALGEGTTAILGLHAWGGACNPNEFRRMADRHGLPLIFDASDGLGSRLGHRRLPSFGLASILSFHQTSLLNGGEGGCIVTDDAALADRMRITRNFHTHEPATRLNGKMSEAQAALATLGLAGIPADIAANTARHHQWKATLSHIDGLSLQIAARDDAPDHHRIVLIVDEAEFGLGRDALIALLARENVLCGERSTWVTDGDFPSARDHAARRILMPNGRDITEDHIMRIGRILTLAARHAGEIAARGRR